MDSVEWGREVGLASPLNNIDRKGMELLEQLEAFAKQVANYGYKVIPYSQTSLRLLAFMSDEQKDQMRDFYRLWSEWITIEATETEVEGDVDVEIELPDESEPLHVSLEKEKYFLKKALTHFGMWAHDDFLDSLKEGQLIEVYNDKMVQVYRNLNFFKYCSYSLFDVSYYPWYQLWQRPSKIQEEMLKFAMEAMERIIPIAPYTVPRHVLRESKPEDLDNGMPAMACSVHFKYIGSLCYGLEKVPVGAIATSHAEIVGTGSDISKLVFI